MFKFSFILAVAAFVAVLSVVSGCGSSPGTATSHSHHGDRKANASHGKDAHGEAGHTHEATHGGIVNTVGNFHVELTYEPSSSRLTVYVTDEDGVTPMNLQASEFGGQAKPEKAEDFIAVTFKAAPTEKDKGGASRFVADVPELKGAGFFELFLRIPHNGKQYRTAYQVEPGKGAAAAKSYRCPMNCENGKVYPEPGACPVCEMDLAEFKGGEIEHADHEPKHGGVFFMAADNWHHIEGVLASPSEFRLYIYDNFTKPISAKGTWGP